MIYDHRGFHFLFYLHGLSGMNAVSCFILKVINLNQNSVHYEVLPLTVPGLMWTSLPVSFLSLSVAFNGNKSLCQTVTKREEGGVKNKESFHDNDFVILFTTYLTGNNLFKLYMCLLIHVTPRRGVYNESLLHLFCISVDS